MCVHVCYYQGFSEKKLSDTPYWRHKHFLVKTSVIWIGLYGFPCGASGKEPTCQCRRRKRPGFLSCIRKEPLEEGMATHSSILPWRIPWTEEPGGLQSMESQRVRHDWSELARSMWGYRRFSYVLSQLFLKPTVWWVGQQRSDHVWPQITHRKWAQHVTGKRQNWLWTGSFTRWGAQHQPQSPPLLLFSPTPWSPGWWQHF